MNINKCISRIHIRWFWLFLKSTGRSQIKVKNRAFINIFWATYSTPACPVVPRWAPCKPHESCYLAWYRARSGVFQVCMPRYHRTTMQVPSCRQTFNDVCCLLAKVKILICHDDVMLLAFVRGNHRSPVNSPHKGRWRRALMISLIWFWTNGWLNNRNAGDVRRHRTHYDVTIMWWCGWFHGYSKFASI